MNYRIGPKNVVQHKTKDNWWIMDQSTYDLPNLRLKNVYKMH